MDWCLPVSTLHKWQYLYYRGQPVLLHMPRRLHRTEMWHWYQRVWSTRTVWAWRHLPQPARFLPMSVSPGIHRRALWQPLCALRTFPLCQRRHLQTDWWLHFWMQLSSRYGTLVESWDYRVEKRQRPWFSRKKLEDVAQLLLRMFFFPVGKRGKWGFGCWGVRSFMVPI